MFNIKRINEPSMSDKTLLITVEDLINRALGPVNCNVVHFKLVQTILHILARQMRLLEQLVEIKIDDLEDFEDADASPEHKGSPTRDKRTKSKLSPRKEKAMAKDKADKDEDKDERVPSKEKGKAEKDKSDSDKATAKERDKEKGADKEKAKADKTTKESAKSAREKSKEKSKRTGSGTSVAVSEVERQKEKVLVVEKGPAARLDRRDSIEVVTRSQFELVSDMVRDLQRRAGPLPSPALPTNQKLRTDIARGSASLTDTMEAMQLAARVNAAEKAVAQMGDLLTQLVASGALPKDALLKIGEAGIKRRPSTVSHKSVAIDPSIFDGSDGDEKPIKGVSRYSVAASRMSMERESIFEMPGVTHPEMEEALQALKDDLMKQAQTMTAKANMTAENANHIARGVSDKLNIALGLSGRITSLTNQVTDYADQLNGFDSGLSTQMSSFRDQMTQIRVDLQAGLAQLALVNNNAETTAIVELNERFEQLTTEMDRILHVHTGLTVFQKRLGDELRSLVECVEMLREQKADRDEVLDGLRDKADNSRLAGLLTALEFAVARQQLETRLAVCHDKFHKQETAWMTALKDLAAVTEHKAEITQLLAARDDAENKLRELQEIQGHLAVLLGEPKAALVMRALSKGAHCGSCLVPALIEPQDPCFGAPPPLPALRPAASDEPCLTTWRPPDVPDDRKHICNRWVGGSHTLLSSAVTRERASPPPAPPRTPTSRFTGHGTDGRLYMMEEELQPCLECNQYTEPGGEQRGGGDHEVTKLVADEK